MNPLAKAIGAVVVLAAGTLGASLEETPFGLPFMPPSTGGDDAGDGNEASDGNETAEGNETADGNETDEGGNETAPGGNETADGNATADGNETSEDGNETSEDGNETADPEEAEPTAERSAACSFHLDESGDDLSSEHHEWEWLVTSDVQHLWVYFRGHEGVPTGLGDQSSLRLIDGNGRTLAHGSSADNQLELFLERGVDAMSDGTWRLVYESNGALTGYDVQVGQDCDKP